jgi:hypothetical protein
MHIDSDSPTDDTSTPHPGKFFIPRSHRQTFVLQFTCMTILGWVVGGIASIALENSILGGLPAADAFHQVKILGNIVFAVIFATDQALVLRRYLSPWLWILATSTGWLIANSVAIAWVKYIAIIARYFHQAISPEIAIFWGFLSTISYTLAAIWLGVCQWWVLRRYVKQVWLWIFLPTVSFLLISISIWLLSLVQNFIPEVNRTPILYWSEQGITAMILGVIPAIGLCTLKTKPHSPSKTSTSSSVFNS